MSENTTIKTAQPSSQFIDGTWIKSRKFDNGDEILKVSFLVDKVVEQLKKYKKSDGFVNLIIAKKKNPDEKSSHYVKLDTWVPNGQKAATPQVKTPDKKVAAPVEIEDNDMF